MQCVLRDKFRLYPNTEDDYDVTLYENSLVFEPCVKGKGLDSYRARTEVKLEDVIGCHVMRVAENATGLKKSVSYFCVYAYHLVPKKKNNLCQRRQKRTYVFSVDQSGEYEANLAVSRVWQSAFLWLLRGVKLERGVDGQTFIPAELPAQRHYLVIVNPKSGPGRSLEIFLHRVRPILAEADISHLLLVTERRNHARDFIKNLQLNQWSGILIISGDGLLYEVYNGLMERPDWELAIKIPIGMIPGGSGNGLARTISHAAQEPYISDPILASTLGIAKGRVAPLDLMKVETPSGPLYSFLNVGWGIMADIDIESEKLRAIGEIRFTLWAFWRVFNLRTYSGRISYLPASEKMLKGSNGVISRLMTSRNGPTAPPPRSRSSGADLGDFCGQNGNTRTLNRSESAPERHPAAGNGTSRSGENEAAMEKATEHAVPNAGEDQASLPVTGEELPPELELVADSSVGRVPGPEPQEPTMSTPEWFPALTDPVPDDWTVEEGRFIICYSSMVSHLGTNLFIAPESRLDDGIAWLLIIRGEVSRFQVLSYFKAQEAGHHVDLPFVRLIPVRAFRLETFSDSTITVDGEQVKTRILQARVLPSLGRILTF
ncbi:sphingosine kinase 1 [Rhipicephalus microplus]|uniref:sphingosine kinase 1 n=1 Tax=Rhipicephalus microplus TaxID=6941 RepID=UPI00188801DA|nr:sphingosine kinase 1-like [Rhipicephalus microplus]